MQVAHKQSSTGLVKVDTGKELCCFSCCCSRCFRGYWSICCSRCCDGGSVVVVGGAALVLALVAVVICERTKFHNVSNTCIWYIKQIPTCYAIGVTSAISQIIREPHSLTSWRLKNSKMFTANCGAQIHLSSTCAFVFVWILCYG